MALKEDAFAEVYESFLDELDTDQFFFDMNETRNENDKDSEMLRLACWQDQLDKVKHLLDEGVNVDGIDKKGETGLMVACGQGHNSIVKALLVAGANIELISNWREKEICALQSPGTQEYFEGIKWVLSSNYSVDKWIARLFSYDKRAIDFAIESDRMETVKILLEAGAIIHNNENAMRYACASGLINDVITLHVLGTDIDEDREESKKTPLAVASKYGHLEIVKYLIKAGADNKKTGLGVPLTLASENGQLAVVKVLLAAGANIKGNDYLAFENGVKCWTPLSIAVENGHLNVVKLLLSEGADIKEVDQSGALRHPVYSNNIALVRTLLSAGADISVTNNAYWENFEDSDITDINGETINQLNDTMLAIAARREYLSMVKILMANGADANHYLFTEYPEEDEDGDRGNVLEIACRKNSIDLVRALLVRGIDGNYNGGAGALAIAARNGNIYIIKALLKAGCNLIFFEKNECDGIDEMKEFDITYEFDDLIQELKSSEKKEHHEILDLLTRHLHLCPNV